MKSPKKNAHLGSSIDNFMRTEGIFADAQKQALEEVRTWQLKSRAIRKTGPKKGKTLRRGR